MENAVIVNRPQKCVIRSERWPQWSGETGTITTVEQLETESGGYTLAAWIKLDNIAATVIFPLSSLEILN